MKRYIILMLLMGIINLPASAQILSLDSCKIYAIEHNKKVIEARLTLEASEQVKKNAFTNYFPRIDAGGLAMKANKPLIEAEVPEMNLPVYDGNPANLVNPTQFAYFPGMSLELLDYVNAGFITAIQPLYMGGKIRNGNKLASLAEEINGYNLELTTDEVLLKTDDYYWTIIALQEKKKTLAKYAELLNNLKKDVEVAYDAGLITKSDLLKVSIEMNQVKANEIKLENGLTLMHMALAQHVGITYSDSFKIETAPLDGFSPESIYMNPAEALINRKEYIMLNKAVDAEILQKNMARAEHLPSLAVGVQGLYLDLAHEQSSFGLAFATLAVPLSGWWGGSHKMNEHKIKVEIAENNLTEKSELIVLQINKTYNDLLESQSQIEVAETSREQAEEYLSVVTDNFEAGVVGTSDLLEAQAMYQKTQDAYVDAKTTFKIKQAYYLQSISKLNM